MPQDILTEAKERWRECTDAYSDERNRMLEDLRFSNPADPQQWHPDARQAREKAEGGARPCLTIDCTNQFIHQVTNDARQNRPGIEVLPVNSAANQKTAAYLEGMIRQIEYASSADIAYDTSIDHGARCGRGWIRVLTEVVNPALNEQEIRIGSVEDPLSCMISPESVKPDGSDAFDGFVETVMSKRAFERKYGTDRHSTWENNGADGWNTLDTIRVAEYYKLITTQKSCMDVVMPDGSFQTMTEDEYWSFANVNGFKPQIVNQPYKMDERSVKWWLMTGDDILDETEVPSEWIPLVPVYGNVLWIDGKRYVCGLTRQLMDGQRFRNMERSSWLELMQMQPKSPFLVAAESVGDFQAQWKNANRSNAAYLLYNARDEEGQPLPAPQRLAPPMSSPALLQAGQQAIDDMQQAAGMYKSNFGAPSNAVSGRAKLQDQREGDTATFHYVDNQRRSIAHVGRIIVGMAPKIYNTEREVRTLNIDGSSSMVRLSQNGPAHQPGNNRSDVINLTAGAYDVRVKSGPSYSTARQESSEALTAILSQNPTLMPIIGPMWARMQDFPEADKLARVLLSMAPPPVQAIENEDSKLDPQAQQMVSALQSQLQQMQQHMQQLMAAANKNLTDAQVKHDELEIERYKAETDRIKALNPPQNPSMTPEEVQVLVMDMLHTASQTQIEQGAGMLLPTAQPPMPMQPPQMPQGAAPPMDQAAQSLPQ